VNALSQVQQKQLQQQPLRQKQQLPLLKHLHIHLL
jgi:hypothetical protein